MEPCPGINLIVGPNASGKTSLLEALFYISRAKSFRTTAHAALIKIGHSAFTLFAELEERESRSRIGIERSASQIEIKINSSEVKKVSELAMLAPIQFVYSNSHKLIEDGPEHRRQFLDWGVFHVEPTFSGSWARYKKALNLRNLDLKNRRSKEQCQAWDTELSQQGEKISEMRSQYLSSFADTLPQAIHHLAGIECLCVRFRSGWNKALSMNESLKNNFDTDYARGFTTAGPHRAEIEILIDNTPARERLSRGQQKLLVICMHIIQAAHMKSITGRPCVILLDDIGAELDSEHLHRLTTFLIDLDHQLFITALDPRLALNFDPSLSSVISLSHTPK